MRMQPCETPFPTVCWNRESELTRFAERVAELAAHTPETLPRRPSLTVISGPLESEEDT